MKKHPQNSQGITVRQRDRALKCTILVHFFRTSLWQFIFFHVALFPYCTICMLHFCVCSNVFMLYFFSCYTPFISCSISYCTFTCYNVFVLHSSHVALFPCCKFFLLHFVHFVLLPEVFTGTHKYLRWRGFQ